MESSPDSVVEAALHALRLDAGFLEETDDLVC